MKWFRKSADQGDVKAQWNLGQLYSSGFSVAKDGAEAVKWYRKAADQGYAPAQYSLGWMYAYKGNGVPKDSAEAAKWYRKAAEQGDRAAQENLGAMYVSGDGVPKDIAEAVNWYRKAADQDSATAQIVLGLMYFNGNGVRQDFLMAAKWFRGAADHNDKNGQYYLGLMYSRGRGVERNEAEAVKWLRMAASASGLIEEHPGAKIELSFIEYPAIKRLKQLADGGDADAQFRIGRMYDQSYWSGPGGWDGKAEAASWYRKAAEQGFASAQIRLGLMYAVGRGILKDSTEAVKWYRKAAEQGHASVQYHLGAMYASGDDVAKDQAEAAKWYRKAADQGYGPAQYDLGLMYFNGEGVAKDYAEAFKWYRRAAEQGEADAQGNLGSMYANGEGVPKDTIEGLAWSNIAAASGDKIFVKNRDALERRVGPEATLAAQQRSKQILKEIEASKHASTAPTPNDPTTRISPTVETPKASGSGTIVSREGHVLTAAHVVAGASRVRIGTAEGTKPASVLRVDEANDLAVLKLASGAYSSLPVAPSRRVRLGQAVATIGFPNVEIQGFSPKVTRGEISSLNGIGDDPRAWQISVPVQSGNSGGALLDENGNLIGVVVSKLGLKALKATGDIPQNVNYAVKSTYALALLDPYLDSNAPEPSSSATKPRFEDMVAKAQQSVVLILVY